MDNISNLLKQKITNYELLIDLRKEEESFKGGPIEAKIIKSQIYSLQCIIEEIELKLTKLYLESHIKEKKEYNYLPGEIWTMD